MDQLSSSVRRLAARDSGKARGKSPRAGAWRRRGTVVLLSLLVGPTLAQTLPDAGAVLRDAQRALTEQPRANTADGLQRAAPAAALPRREAGVRFTAERFELEGRTLVPEEDIQRTLAPWLGRPIGFQDLEEAAIAVTALYAARGWLVRASWPAQEIANGRVRLQLVEGRLGQVRLQMEPGRLDADLPTRVLTARQKPGEVLRLDDVERATRLLNDTPGVAGTVFLAEGREAGQADLLVQVRNTALLSAWAQLDNAGSRSTGSARAVAMLALNNPNGFGDQLALDALATSRSLYGRVGYSLPVGVDGARFGVQLSGLRYRLGQEYAALDVRGGATTFSVNGNWRLLRTADRNLSATVSLEEARLDNRAAGETLSDKRNRVLRFGLAGDISGLAGDGSYGAASVQWSFGKVSLTGPADAQAADAAGPRTAGGFGKLSASASWLQPLGSSTSLALSVLGQRATRNLDGAEAFTLGGINGVRAYPAQEGRGDEGVLATIELRQRLGPYVQGSLFCDQGRIRVRHDAGYDGAPALNGYTLRGCGVGVQASGWRGATVAVAVARRIGRNPAALPTTGADQDGSRPGTRVWLTASINF